MAATKTKPEPKPAPEPITFDAIAAKRMAERLTQYREFVSRQARGEMLAVADMEAVADLLDLLGLPHYAHERDVQAMARFKAATEKYEAAAKASPEHAIRAQELHAEVEQTQNKLAVLREQLQLARAKQGKPFAYEQTLKQLQAEHPHVLADLDLAVRLRTEELDRRKRATTGGAA